MNDNVQRISDRGLAAYLLEKGFFCAKAIPSNARDTRRMDFIFIDLSSPILQRLEHDYLSYKREELSAKSLDDKNKRLGRLLKEGLTREELENLKNGA